MAISKQGTGELAELLFGEINEFEEACQGNKNKWQIIGDEIIKPSADDDTNESELRLNAMIRKGEILNILFLNAPIKENEEEKRNREVDLYLETLIQNVPHEKKTANSFAIAKTILQQYFCGLPEEIFPIVIFNGHGSNFCGDEESHRSCPGGDLVFRNGDIREYVQLKEFVKEVTASFRQYYQHRKGDNYLRIILAECYSYKICPRPEDVHAPGIEVIDGIKVVYLTHNEEAVTFSSIRGHMGLKRRCKRNLRCVCS